MLVESGFMAGCVEEVQNERQKMLAREQSTVNYADVSELGMIRLTESSKQYDTLQPARIVLGKPP